MTKRKNNFLDLFKRNLILDYTVALKKKKVGYLHFVSLISPFASQCRSMIISSYSIRCFNVFFLLFFLAFMFFIQVIIYYDHLKNCKNVSQILI